MWPFLLTLLLQTPPDPHLDLARQVAEHRPCRFRSFYVIAPATIAPDLLVIKHHGVIHDAVDEGTVIVYCRMSIPPGRQGYYEEPETEDRGGWYAVEVIGGDWLAQRKLLPMSPLPEVAR